MKPPRIYNQPIRNGSTEWLREMIDMETEPYVGIEVVALEFRKQTGADPAPRAYRAGDGRNAATSPDARVLRAREQESDIDAGLPGVPIRSRGDSGEAPLLSLSKRQAGG